MRPHIALVPETESIAAALEDEFEDHTWRDRASIHRPRPGFAGLTDTVADLSGRVETILFVGLAGKVSPKRWHSR